MMRAFLLILLALLTSCGRGVDRSLVHSSPGGDVVEVLDSAISHIAAQEPVAALVAAGDLDPVVLRALEVFRLPVLGEQESSNPHFSLAAGHLAVKEISISENRAFVRAILGPVPVPRERVLNLSCGSTYRINLARQAGGRWRVVDSQVVVC
jgi:hypothetical protein